jgi:hypothetical protein
MLLEPTGQLPPAPEGYGGHGGPCGKQVVGDGMSRLWKIHAFSLRKYARNTVVWFECTTMACGMFCGR